MGPRTTLLVTLAVVVAVLAALPLGKGAGHGGEGAAAAALKDKEDATAGAWPCCDNCGRCYQSVCGCRDLTPGGCRPGCTHCFHSATTIGGVLLFQCEDVIKNYCARRCTPAQSK